MDKVIKFCKEKYKILIPVMVVVVLLITVYFLYREYRYDSYRNKVEAKVYQYFGGIRTDYTAVLTYNLSDKLIEVKPKTEKIEYDSTPIYYQKEDKVLFVKEMNIAFPLREGSQYKLYKYSFLEEVDGADVITTNSGENTYTNFFLYDGKGLYFFVNEMTIYIDGEEYIKLSPMSYVEIIGGYTMVYYDKETNDSKVLEIEGKEITAVSDNINVNLSRKYILVSSKKILLADPSNLNAVSN